MKMQIISQTECEEWFKANLGPTLTLATMDDEYPHSATYWHPAEVTKLTALAHFVIHYASLDTTRPGLFWITTWGIYGSGENMALFDGYRKSLGENRDINAAPGHVFGESDVQQLECLLGLALYFYWDAILFEGGGGIAFKCSHDEFVSVHAKGEERLRQFTENLDRLSLKPWGS
jgi:hypothetical protein